MVTSCRARRVVIGMRTDFKPGPIDSQRETQRVVWGLPPDACAVSEPLQNAAPHLPQIP